MAIDNSLKKYVVQQSVSITLTHTIFGKDNRQDNNLLVVNSVVKGDLESDTDEDSKGGDCGINCDINCQTNSDKESDRKSDNEGIETFVIPLDESTLSQHQVTIQV